MKKFIKLFLILIIAGNSEIFPQSIVDIQSGTIVEIGDGAVICADIKTGDGMLTGGGTWCEIVLPVELISFISEIKGNDVTLRWTTAREINNSGFEIHRSVSSDHPEWVKEGFVQGHSNTSGPVNYSFTDTDLPPGKYIYRLKQIDYNGNYEYHDLSNEVVTGTPDKFILYQNFPNPFNPETVITYQIPEECYVMLKVYNSAGILSSSLTEEIRQAGVYSVRFNGAGLSSGVYFCVLKTVTLNKEADLFSSVKRMMFVK